MKVIKHYIIFFSTFRGQAEEEETTEGEKFGRG